MRRFYPSVWLFLIVSLVAVAQDSAKPSPSAAATNTSNKTVTNAPSNGDKTDNSVIEEDPVTVKTTSDNGTKKPVHTDPIFGVPPLPEGKTSLVGGTVAGIDGVHNRLSVKVFGKGGKWNVAFDERTHFFVDGAETTFEKVKKGERVYVDTMLDKHRIFARNVHIVTKTGPASARGQVSDVGNGMMTLQDQLSDRPVHFRVDGETQVKRAGSSASLGDVQPGSIITVQFQPGNEGRGIAREITILAAPGQNVTFAGTVRNLDLRNNQLAVENHTDNKTYEISFEGDKQIPPNLMVGSEVTVAAVFDGRGYKANSISVSK
ncbi:MAG: DUF5666 domain-containing protein [Terriglobales bacterium]